MVMMGDLMDETCVRLAMGGFFFCDGHEELGDAGRRNDRQETRRYVSTIMCLMLFDEGIDHGSQRLRR